MTRENAFLAVLFAILAVVILVVDKPFSADVYEETAQRSRALFPEFDGAVATRIEVRAPEREAIVERGEDGLWKVTSRFGYPADGNTVQDLFTRLQEIRVSDWISDRPEDRDRYNVGDSGIRFRVTDRGGATLAAFVQGKFSGIDPEDPNFERKFNFDVFLRREDSGEIFLVPSFIPIGTTPAEWLDRSLVRFDPTTARAFSIERADGERVRVEKGEDGTWRIVEPTPGPANPGKVDEWLRAFGYSSMKDVAGVGGGSAFGLDAPSVRVQAELQDGTTREIWFGSRNETKEVHASKGAGDPFVYLVQEFTYDQLGKSAADFAEAPPPPPEGATPPGEAPPADAPPVETRPASPETRPADGTGEIPK